MNQAAVLHSALHDAHALILLCGALGVASVLASLVSRRIGAPVLLLFLGLGIEAGEDGVLGIPFDDFSAAYVIGSIALAVILFEGGLRTSLARLRAAVWPALVLATVGVAATAALVGLGVAWLDRLPLAGALLAGAVASPTDAAAVAALLRGSRAAVPERLMAVLEVESGLNDPMSVFLTFLLLRLFAGAEPMTVAAGVLDFARQMVGGGAIGLAAGWALTQALRRLRIEAPLATVLALAASLAVFGLGQLLGTSGFLATYLAGIVVGAGPGLRASLEPFFEGLGWLAQITLFLMLGLLVTPHTLLPFIPLALLGAALLMFVARPLATFACLLPFGFSLRESAFASWVGLRGAVPIYLSLIPALVDRGRDAKLFAIIFIVVVTSLLVQGWTIGLAARLLGFGARSGPGAA